MRQGESKTVGIGQGGSKEVGTSGAYWLLLKDFTAEPQEGQKTISLRIPKENQLSANP